MRSFFKNATRLVSFGIISKIDFLVKPGLFLTCVCLLCTAGIYADNSESDFSKGPLYGKNLYIPYLIHYNFPSLPAKSGECSDLQYHFSLYYIQDVNYRAKDMSGYDETDWSERRYDKINITRDYESCAAELGVAYNFSKQLQTGMDMRLYAYYGGFLDPALEAYHNVFGFKNGGREYFLQNRIYINIQNANGITIFLDEPACSFGDIDLWGKWTFWENRKVSLAALAAFKLPTGSLSSLSGSGYPDTALGLLSDFRVLSFLTLYSQAGIVVPFNGKSYPMFNGLLGTEIHPWKKLSFNLQMNIKTSPITDVQGYKQYSKPQTNILAGAVLQYKTIKLQFYMEEDAFTHQGTDITISFMFSQTINLKNRN